MAKIDENNMNTISFVTDEGEKVVLEVLEQTTIAGCNYILVADEVAEDGAEDQETQAYIMKEVMLSDEEGVATYEFVEDDQELASISKIFEELLEDTDLV